MNNTSVIEICSTSHSSSVSSNNRIELNNVQNDLVLNYSDSSSLQSAAPILERFNTQEPRNIHIDEVKSSEIQSLNCDDNEHSSVISSSNIFSESLLIEKKNYNTDQRLVSEPDNSAHFVDNNLHIDDPKLCSPSFFSHDNNHSKFISSSSNQPPSPSQSLTSQKSSHAGEISEVHNVNLIESNYFSISKYSLDNNMMQQPSSSLQDENAKFGSDENLMDWSKTSANQPEDVNQMCPEDIGQGCRVSDTENGVELLDTYQSWSTTEDSKYCLNLRSVPLLLTSDNHEFESKSRDNFLRGCKWSPDSSCIVTNSNDDCLRIFKPFEFDNLDEHGRNSMSSKVKVKESGQIYDFAWHPGMSQSHPEACRVVTTCSGKPIHMWDSESGGIVANYRAYDQYDEVTSAYSLSFSCDGSKMYAGYNKAIRIFDVEFPVKQCQLVKTTNSKTKDGQTGIISCFAHDPSSYGLYAAGSYSRHIGLYDCSCDKLVCLIQGQQGGVTHIQFSPDGTKLYSGGRKDAEILCWDTRNMGHILFSALRDVKTNQRIYFDQSQSGRYLVSGNNDGTVIFWDTLGPCQDVNGDVFLKPCSQFVAHGDCVNGVSFNHQHHMIGTSSGQRHFDMLDDTDSEDELIPGHNVRQRKSFDFSLKIWKIPQEGCRDGVGSVG